MRFASNHTVKDVERDQFTQEIPYGSACERCLGRVLVIRHACREIVLLKS
ncbi:MAG: hypothetical protein ABSH09_07955 [Bryobacteraceae bacterium]|jgi:hypothetical protein